MGLSSEKELLNEIKDAFSTYEYNFNIFKYKSLFSPKSDLALVIENNINSTAYVKVTNINKIKFDVNISYIDNYIDNADYFNNGVKIKIHKDITKQEVIKILSIIDDTLMLSYAYKLLDDKINRKFKC